MSANSLQESIQRAQAQKKPPAQATLRPSAPAAQDDWPRDFPPRDSIDPRRDVLPHVQISESAWGRWMRMAEAAVEDGPLQGLDAEQVQGEFAQPAQDGQLFVYMVLPGDMIFGTLIDAGEWREQEEVEAVQA